ncbi:MAG: hypothetical protein GOP50_09060 [Candidatus Heimdallarchaeota archaeon]|nr:hypothetical protein [Candidatus Heimdallarchaeota archaeon]
MRILFDETQKERGKIHDNFQKLSELLEKEGHEISRYDSYPIKYTNITEYDILVLLCPDSSKLYGHEVKALLRFVDEGGAIAIFANAGGDKGLNTNLNTLLKHFKIATVSNQIFDYENYELELESNAVVSKFYQHPITDGLKEIVLVSSCSLQLEEGDTELARTSSSSDPPSSAVAAITSYGLGTIFVCGSYLIFSDKKAGLDLRDNATFAKNIFAHIGTPPMSLGEETIEEELVEESTEVEKEPYEAVSKIEMVKEALNKGETDHVKTEVIKAMQTLRAEVKSTRTETKEVDQKMSKTDIYEAIAIIQELEKEIDELKIEDQGYRDILLTDMARREGIDYSQVLPYMEKMKEKSQRDKQKKEDRKRSKADISSIPEPRTPEMDQFEKDLMIFDQRLESLKPEPKAVDSTTQSQMMGDLIQSIRELKNSVDVLSANLIHLMSEIVLELKEQKGKRKIF